MTSDEQRAFDDKCGFAETTVHLLNAVAERDEKHLLPLAEVVSFTVRWLERLELARPTGWRNDRVGGLLAQVRAHADDVERLAPRRPDDDIPL